MDVFGQCDIFSFGVLLWEIVQESRAWAEIEEDTNKIAEKLLRGETLPLDDITPDSLRDLLHNCFQTNPNLRPTAKEVYTQIEDIIAQLRRESSVLSSEIPLVDISDIDTTHPIGEGTESRVYQGVWRYVCVCVCVCVV